LELPERKRNPFTNLQNGGRILSAMMLPLFQLCPPRGFGVLSTTGRKTGKRRPRCIHAIRQGERVYIVMIRPTPRAVETHSISAWVLNIRTHPVVGLRIRDGSFTGIARELSDPEEIAQATEIYCSTVNPFDYVECMFHRPGRPTRAKIEELHRSWFKHGAPLVIELDGVGGAQAQAQAATGNP
jgi:hypothetical protein